MGIRADSADVDPNRGVRELIAELP